MESRKVFFVAHLISSIFSLDETWKKRVTHVGTDSIGPKNKGFRWSTEAVDLEEAQVRTNIATSDKDIPGKLT